MANALPEPDKILSREFRERICAQADVPSSHFRRAPCFVRGRVDACERRWCPDTEWRPCSLYRPVHSRPVRTFL